MTKPERIEREEINEFFKLNERYIEIEKRYNQFNDVQSIYDEFLRIKEDYSSYKAIFEKIDNKISLSIFDNLKLTLSNYIKKLNELNFKKGISRNECKYKDFLFIQINEDIRDIISLRKDTSFIVFFEANSDEDCFDKRKLIDFFEKQVLKLINISQVNYYNLIQFYNSFSKDISTLIN